LISIGQSPVFLKRKDAPQFLKSSTDTGKINIIIRHFRRKVELYLWILRYRRSINPISLYNKLQGI
jgi:hypothetical protein